MLEAIKLIEEEKYEGTRSKINNQLEKLEESIKLS